MKIVKLGDLHVGVRGGNIHFRNFIKAWLLEYFLPWCVANGVDRIIQYGDFFDVRKSLYGLDKEWIEKEFIPACVDAGIDWDLLIGNHDIQLRHSNRSFHQSIFTEICPEIFSVYSEPTEVEIDGELHLMLPWINEEGREGSNYDQCIEAIKNSKAKYCHGHLEMEAFPLNRVSNCEHGMDVSIFAKFERVDTGHFHCRSERQNITYVGTPYPLTWIDHGDERGFDVWDSETGKTEFIKSDQTLLTQVCYDYDAIADDADLLKTLKDEDRIQKAFGGRIVKIFVKSKSNSRHYKAFMDAIRKAGCIDYQVVDETVTALVEVKVDETALHMDTAATLTDYISQQDQLDADPMLVNQIAIELLGDCDV